MLLTKSPVATVTQEILDQKAAEKFKDLKFEGGIHIVDEIPRIKTFSAKIDRNRAKEIAFSMNQNRLNL